MVPSPKTELICTEIENSVSTLQSVVELGRYLRDKVNSPLKYPLPEVVVIHKDKKVLDDVLLLESYIKEELNVRTITTSTDKEKYGVALKAEINFKLLGARLKGDVKKVQEVVGAFSDDEVQALLDRGHVDILGHRIGAEEVVVRYRFGGERAADLSSRYEAHSDPTVLILLDVTPSQEMLDEGLARVITNRLQKLRKKAALVPTDDATVWYEIRPATGDLARIADAYAGYIETATKTSFKKLAKKPQIPVLIQEESKINEDSLLMVITTEMTSASGR